jgi:hypothetical protein
MTTTSQPWIRAELIATSGTTFGPQLMIPADGLEFHGTDLVFHHQGEVVYVAEAGQLRSVTWIGKQPSADIERRKAQWPKHGTRWTGEEREQLRTRLLAGEPWSAIATAHGRSRTGVQQEAVKQGWVTAETYQVRPGLAAPEAPEALAAAPAGSASEPPTVTSDLRAEASGPAVAERLPSDQASAVPQPSSPEPRSGAAAISSHEEDAPYKRSEDTSVSPDHGQPPSVFSAGADPGAPSPLASSPESPQPRPLREPEQLTAPRPRPELTAGPRAET